MNQIKFPSLLLNLYGKSGRSRFSSHGFVWSQLAVIGTSLALLASSLSEAEQFQNREERTERPSRGKYQYLICGGGVAAQEALKTFVERKSADSLLIVAEEWRELFTNSTSKPEHQNYEEHGLLSTLLQKAQGAASFVSTGRRGPEVVIGPRVKSIDTKNRVATLSNGDDVSFERCLIAVGTSMPNIPIGTIVSQNAAKLVSGAQSDIDWNRIESAIRDCKLRHTKHEEARPHLTVVGGGWMSPIVGASLVARGADVTFSYAEPFFLARYLPRYIVARKSLDERVNAVEAEVHVGTVFDAFSITDFRTDHLIFAPTLTPQLPLEATNLSCGKEGLTVNPELAVASDVYVAGSAIDVGSAAIRHSHVMRWSSEHSRATGRHAAMNMMGGREPYDRDPEMTIGLDALNLKIHVIGNVDGSCESFGYFLRTKHKDEDTCGGQLKLGVVFYATPSPLSHRGATQELRITGLAIWEGSASHRITDIDATKEAAVRLLSKEAMKRPELEATMDEFSGRYLGIRMQDLQPRISQGSKLPDTLQEGQDEEAYETDNSHLEKHSVVGEKQAGENKVTSKVGPAGPRRSSGIIWRRHKSARSVKIREDELLWAEDEWFGVVSPESKSDRVAKAYSDLLRQNAGLE